MEEAVPESAQQTAGAGELPASTEEGRPEPSATTGTIESVVAPVEQEAPAEAGLVDITSILGAPTVTVVRSNLKSTDLSWEGEEPDTATTEENPPAAVEESASLPQAETVAQGAEATLPEATVVEETQVEGTMIPEAVSAEGTAPKATVLEGATTEPEVPVAP